MEWAHGDVCPLPAADVEVLIDPSNKERWVRPAAAILGAGANATQHGGDHYKKLKIQTWDYIAANGIGYFEGNAIKYLSRWRDKGGIEDLRKAQHYITKLIETELAKSVTSDTMPLLDTQRNPSC